MRRRIFVFFGIIMVVLFSCSGGGNQPGQQKQDEKIQGTVQPVEIDPEARALLDYLEESGDYVNSREFPSLISPASVYEELDGNIHIIDVRSAEAFSKGHIRGAVNVAFENIPDYLSSDIKPFEFERIVIACYAGQIASYTTSLLRLMGYGNVYAMRWGMSGWHKDFGSYWLDSVSSAYEDKLETADREKAVAGDFPKMNTGKTSGEETPEARFRKLFSEGCSQALISAEKVFENPDRYYIINYDRRDKYESGHIPGAIRYKTNGTLGIVSEMQTIPAGREIVVYCGTGHNSGFVTAYLRLFGYDAKTLMYGNNAFMHNKMITEKTVLSWLPFTETEIEDFPYVK